MMNRGYIVVTPCKDEGDNLPSLIESMSSQTILPLLWLIVDDGSTDKTPEIIKEAQERYPWIESVNTGLSKRDLGLHFARISRMGFEMAHRISEERGLVYSYLSSLDGDQILPDNYYEYLIERFEEDPKLGIAGGGIDYTVNGTVVESREGENEPSGGNMLIRRECYVECGGIPISYTPDSVLKAKARLRGWKTRRFEEIRTRETRDAWNAEGYWKGYLMSGKSAYYRNIHPAHAILKALQCTFKRPYYIGIPYLLGYFGSLVMRRPKIEDPEIRDYYWNKWREHIRL